MSDLIHQAAAFGESYQPMTKPPRGMNPNFRAVMHGRCDVCGFARGMGKHDKCSQIRKAAGFKFIGGTDPNAKVKCKDCKQEHKHGEMMGNVCRECHVKTLARAAGFGGEV